MLRKLPILAAPLIAIGALAWLFLARDDSRGVRGRPSHDARGGVRVARADPVPSTPVETSPRESPSTPKTDDAAPSVSSAPRSGVRVRGQAFVWDGHAALPIAGARASLSAEVMPEGPLSSDPLLGLEPERRLVELAARAHGHMLADLATVETGLDGTFLLDASTATVESGAALWVSVAQDRGGDRLFAMRGVFAGADPVDAGNVELRRLLVFDVRVVSAGSPVPGATASGVDALPTDEQGITRVSFLEFPTPIQLRTIFVGKRGFAAERLFSGPHAAEQVEQAARGQLTVELAPESLVAGRVLDPDGNPIGRASVTIDPQPADAEPRGAVVVPRGTQAMRLANRRDVFIPLPEPIGVTAGDDGRFVVHGLRAGAYELVVEPPRGALVGASLVVRAPAASVEVRLERSRSLTAAVRLPAGVSVEGDARTALLRTLRVQVADGEGWRPWEATRKVATDGRLEVGFDGLPLRRVRVVSAGASELGVGSGVSDPVDLGGASGAPEVVVDFNREESRND